jgi:glycosyltransferase involved in cell wall biosynthesis
MRIAFCKFAGLANGGIEKYLQTIAILYKENGHEVDYYYTNAAPILNQWWQHPDNDQNRISLLKSKNINLISIHVEARNGYEWVNSDFFNKFDESKYDYLILAGTGGSEYPFYKLNSVKMIHTIHGDYVFNKENIYKSVLITNWQKNNWINSGGDVSKLEVIPPIVYVPDEYPTNFREKNNIPKDAFVFGFHQRDDDSISLTVSLESFQKIQNMNLEKKIFFILLGGGKKHRDYITNNCLKNTVVLNATSKVEEIHSFLEAIDVYTHCRLDGEVCSASIIEAMSHSKPIITYPGINMGHAEQVEGCGKMAYSINEYSEEMLKLLSDNNYYNQNKIKVKDKYIKEYDYKVVNNKLLSLLKN